MYRPESPFTVPFKLLTPVEGKINGVKTKQYMESPELFYGSFKTFGGSETTVNGIYSIEDTASVESWYSPELLSCCRIKRMQDQAVFEIINEPENIEMRNQFSKCKVRRLKGGV